MSWRSHRVVGSLPRDLRLTALEPHSDKRGTFIELYREEWETGVAPIRWNAVHSEAGVLRGVHVHPTHDAYLTIVRGRATVGLRDLRQGSPTEGATACVELSEQRPTAISIPHGVAHGFYFHEASTHVYAVSHYWNLVDELGCPLGRPGPGDPLAPARCPHLPRDKALPSLGTLLGELRAA